MAKKRESTDNQMLPLDLEEPLSISERDLIDGRDELNLAEFPICSLAGRGAREDTKVFSDQLWDKDTKSYITRTLTVEAPKRVGIPNSTDEDIILALIQISRRQNFPKKVRFSRYELLKVLNWDDSGRTYKRIEDAILRWNKTTLTYENAWRRILEDGTKVWTQASFHIIEDFEFNKKGSAYSPDFCTIIWGERTQESFVNGFLKKLNFRQYLDFKSDITKRMYRFLDKRFWLKKRWKFDLKEFAYEKIGIGRNYNVAQLKQRLEKAIQELVQIGFITDMPKHERYEKARVGEWFIVFQAIKQPESQKSLKLEEETELSDLEKLLVQRGIRSAMAKKLVAEYPEDVVSEQIEVFDYLVGKHASKPPTAGFLVTSIRDHFKHEFPEGFKTNQQKLREAAERKEKQLAKDLSQKKKMDEISRLKAEKAAQEKRIQEFFNSLSDKEKKKVKDEAKAEAQEAGMLDRTNKGLTENYLKMCVADILLKQMGETEVELPSL